MMTIFTNNLDPDQARLNAGPDLNPNPLSLSDVVFIMQINVKMPTIVGILTLMSRINFVLS